MATAEKVEAKNEKARRSRALDSWITRRSRKYRASSVTCWRIRFALYLKTKNFHWHMTGKNFRDYHLLLDEHGGSDLCHDRPGRGASPQTGGTTLHSISEIASHQRLKDNNGHHVPPKAMLGELLRGQPATDGIASFHSTRCAIATTTWQPPA